jgi:hypothetical protein
MILPAILAFIVGFFVGFTTLAMFVVGGRLDHDNH